VAETAGRNLFLPDQFKPSNTTDGLSWGSWAEGGGAVVVSVAAKNWRVDMYLCREWWLLAQILSTRCPRWTQPTRLPCDSDAIDAADWTALLAASEGDVLGRYFSFFLLLLTRLFRKAGRIFVSFTTFLPKEVFAVLLVSGGTPVKLPLPPAEIFGA